LLNRIHWKKKLNESGFSNVQLVVPDGDITQVVTAIHNDPTLAKDISIVGGKFHVIFDEISPL
jgi:hypothetical protein